MIAAKPEARRPPFPQLWDCMLDPAIRPSFPEPVSRGYQIPEIHNVLANFDADGGHLGRSGSTVGWIG